MYKQIYATSCRINYSKSRRIVFNNYILPSSAVHLWLWQVNYTPLDECVSNFTLADLLLLKTIFLFEYKTQLLPTVITRLNAAALIFVVIQNRAFIQGWRLFPTRRNGIMVTAQYTFLIQLSPVKKKREVGPVFRHQTKKAKILYAELNIKKTQYSFFELHHSVRESRSSPKLIK